MCKLLHLLLSIQWGRVEGEGMGMFRHLLSSIPLGQRMGKFVIHVRRFIGGGE